MAICEDFLGIAGPGVAVTVAKPEGLCRRVIRHDGSIHGIAQAIRGAADWISGGAVVVEGVKRVY